MNRKRFVGVLARYALGAAVGAALMDKLEPEASGGGLNLLRDAELDVNGHKVEGWDEAEPGYGRTVWSVFNPAEGAWKPTFMRLPPHLGDGWVNVEVLEDLPRLERRMVERLAAWR